MAARIICALALLMSMAFTACEKEGPAERAGEKVDKATQKAGEALDKAGEKAQDATK